VFDDVERDVGLIRLPRWGRVVSVAGTVPWLVVDPDGVPVEPVRRFLVDFVARDNRPGSVRSYADLCRHRHKSHYAERRIMPSGRVNVLVSGG
jgi:hypothetical protein